MMPAQTPPHRESAVSSIDTLMGAGSEATWHIAAELGDDLVGRTGMVAPLGKCSLARNFWKA